MQPQRYFRVPLVRRDEVWQPEPEIGRAPVGVTDEFLVHAEAYFQKYERFAGAGDMLSRHLDRLGIELEGVAIDVGSGFGNSVIPLLQKHTKLRVVATDISERLLAILRREAKARGLDDRCAAVAMDVHNDYFKPKSADFALGLAILHHLINPVAAVASVLRALRPGGRAVFVEPFQAGHLIMQIAFTQIADEAERRGESGRAFDALRALARDIGARSHRAVPADNLTSWEQLDDKWLFSRAHFEHIAAEVGCTHVDISPVGVRQNFLRNQTEVALAVYHRVELSELPDWAWSIIDRFDNEFLTDDMKAELLLEGVVTVTR